jgi:hypothetical protein
MESNLIIASTKERPIAGLSCDIGSSEANVIRIQGSSLMTLEPLYLSRFQGTSCESMVNRFAFEWQFASQISNAGRG